MCPLRGKGKKGGESAGPANRSLPLDACVMASTRCLPPASARRRERASALVMKPGSSEPVSCEGSEFEELATQLLGAGHAMRFRARGSSMYPLVRDGDILDVWPVGSAGADVGDVVLYRSSGHGIVVHRVVGVRRLGKETVLLVKGDSVKTADPQVQESQVLGRVVNIERRGRRLAPVPCLWRYRSSLFLRLLPLRRRAYAVLHGALRRLRSLLVGEGCRS